MAIFVYCLALITIFWTGIRIGDDLALADILLGIAMAVTWLTKLGTTNSLYKRRARDPGKFYIYSGLVFICVGFTISGVYRGTFLTSVLQSLQYLFLILWFLVGSKLSFSIKSVKLILLSITISASVSSVAAVFQSVGLLEVPYPLENGRMTGLARHPVELGGTACVGFVISISCFLMEWYDIRYRLANLFLAFLCALGVVLSASMSGLVTSIVGLFALMTIRKRLAGERLSPKIIISVIAILCVSAIIFGISVSLRLVDINDPNFILNRFSNVSDINGEYNTAAIRYEGYREAWSFIKNNLVFGSGVHSVTIAGDEIHNIFLKAWVDAGVVAFIGSCLAIFGAIYSIARGFYYLTDTRTAILVSGAHISALTFILNAQAAPVSSQRSGWIAIALLIGCSDFIYSSYATSHIDV